MMSLLQDLWQRNSVEAGALGLAIVSCICGAILIVIYTGLTVELFRSRKRALNNDTDNDVHVYGPSPIKPKTPDQLRALMHENSAAFGKMMATSGATRSMTNNLPDQVVINYEPFIEAVTKELLDSDLGPAPACVLHESSARYLARLMYERVCLASKDEASKQHTSEVVVTDKMIDAGSYILTHFHDSDALIASLAPSDLKEVYIAMHRVGLAEKPG